MPAIFIDANIYLRLYEEARVAALLPALRKIRGQVFVSQQIVNEVERNRLPIAARHLKQLGPIRIANVNVPDVLGSPAEVKSLKRRIDAARKQADRAHDEFQALATRRLRAVAEGTDRITKGLAPLFLSAKRETPEQLDRARLRKELGQRPGKRGDPLGDEVSWEQFVEQLEHDDHAIVVSSDGDFMHELDDGAVLQPSLDRDVRHKTKGGALVVTKLSDLIGHLKRASPSQAGTLPSEKTLSDAAQAEAGLATAGTWGPVIEEWLSGQLIMAGTPHLAGRPSSVPLMFETLICPKCGNEMSRLRAEAWSSFIGVSPEPWQCRKCGYVEKPAS